VETLEAVRKSVLAKKDQPQVLTGDFNTPQLELPDGTVVTWAQRVEPTGMVRLKRQIRGGPGSRWDAAERGILIGLGEIGVRDLFRELASYSIVEGSWAPRKNAVLRRFDHIFASSDLEAKRCEYLHDPRHQGLSDHSALEADVFFDADGVT
jgi:endonuclease/exonuclease/phosphatase family metal-dependent hydrolase